MPYSIHIIRANGTIEHNILPKAPNDDYIRKAIGGWMETVPHFTKLGQLKRGLAYADEEGILKRKPFNAEATKLWKLCLGAGPFAYEPKLYGDVIFYAKTKTETRS